MWWGLHFLIPLLNMGWKDFSADIYSQEKRSKNDIARDVLVLAIALLITAMGFVMENANNPATAQAFTIAFWVSLGLFILFFRVLRSKQVKPIGSFTAVGNTLTITLFNEVPDTMQFSMSEVQKFKASIPNKPYTSPKSPAKYKCNLQVKVNDRNFDLLLDYKGLNQQANLLRLMEGWKAVLNDISITKSA